MVWPLAALDSLETLLPATETESLGRQEARSHPLLKHSDFRCCCLVGSAGNIRRDEGFGAGEAEPGAGEREKAELPRNKLFSSATIQGQQAL